jgi:RNAse (barnase) inhibitor barstar
VRLVWHDADASRANLGPALFRRILDVFDEAQEQDTAFGWEDRFVYELR